MCSQVCEHKSEHHENIITTSRANRKEAQTGLLQAREKWLKISRPTEVGTLEHTTVRFTVKGKAHTNKHCRGYCTGGDNILIIKEVWATSQNGSKN